MAGRIGKPGWARQEHCDKERHLTELWGAASVMHVRCTSGYESCTHRGGHGLQVVMLALQDDFLQVGLGLRAANALARVIELPAVVAALQLTIHQPAL